MTICIAAICKQGSTLILSADRMLTSDALSIQFEHPSKKASLLSDSCIALTAGDALAHTELFNEVQGEIAKLRSPSVSEVVTKIKECYQRIRAREIGERILLPRGIQDLSEFLQIQTGLVTDIAFAIQNQIDTYNYGLHIMVGGVSEGVAHIYGISDPGTSQCFDAIGFHAIGSGMPHAMTTLIGRGCNQEFSLEEGLLVVYEAKKMAEKAPGVGSNVTDTYIVDTTGIYEFPQDKYEELHRIYEQWISREPTWTIDLATVLDRKENWKK